jgi:hypothetical protein
MTDLAKSITIDSVEFPKTPVSNTVDEFSHEAGLRALKRVGREYGTDLLDAHFKMEPLENVLTPIKVKLDPFAIEAKSYDKIFEAKQWPTPQQFTKQTLIASNIQPFTEKIVNKQYFRALGYLALGLINVWTITHDAYLKKDFGLFVKNGLKAIVNWEFGNCIASIACLFIPPTCKRIANIAINALASTCSDRILSKAINL